MSIDSDQRKRRGAPETLPVSHFDKFLTTPKKAKTSDDGFDNLEVDQIGKRVSKLGKCGISFRVMVVSIEGMCL